MSTNSKINAYAALEAKKSLQPWQYEPAPLDSDSVQIDVTHNGLCHTDIHMRDNDWGISQFPLVPGHEVVGTVTRTGDRVTHLSIGDRVGFGWIRNSCRRCDYCLQGQENICREGYTGLIVGHHGGFADKLQAPADFAFRIPDALDSVYAAPLLCAGITVYTPLRTHITHPGMKIGVIGIGGLGHLAIQFAYAMGAEVTAFSTSADKEQEARQFGAHHFRHWTPATLKNMAGSQDLLLNTAPSAIDWQATFALLGNNGKLCLVGIPASADITLPLSTLVFGQKSLVGSIVGGRTFMNEMLSLAAAHHIVPMVETMPLSDINKAMDQVATNKARYRIVLTSDA